MINTKRTGEYLMSHYQAELSAKALEKRIITIERNMANGRSLGKIEKILFDMNYQMTEMGNDPCANLQNY